jgi:hypothetical protein
MASNSPKHIFDLKIKSAHPSRLCQQWSNAKSGFVEMIAKESEWIYRFERSSGQCLTEAAAVRPHQRLVRVGSTFRLCSTESSGLRTCPVPVPDILSCDSDCFLSTSIFARFDGATTFGKEFLWQSEAIGRTPSRIGPELVSGRPKPGLVAMKSSRRSDSGSLRSQIVTFQNSGWSLTYARCASENQNHVLRASPFHQP